MNQDLIIFFLEIIYLKKIKDGPYIFSLITGIGKKLLNITRNKKEKHDEILMLTKSKLNSSETLISQALIDVDISHILKEKDRYERVKENLRSENEEYLKSILK